jgi:molybdopterin-synthase adenylyltransferase
MNRYEKQELFRPIGKEGQTVLQTKTAVIAGVGALGSALAHQLTRAGIGRLILIDRDVVEKSNLQRQTLFIEKDSEDMVPKVVAAKERLNAINSLVDIEAHFEQITGHNADTLLKDADVVLDGTDNFETRYILNDVCMKNNIPYVYGGVAGSTGTVAVFIRDKTCCLRCLLGGRMSGETCDANGVIMPAVEITASYQTVEALKILTDQSNLIIPTMLTFDVWNRMNMETKLPLSKADCPVCIKNIFPALQKDFMEAVVLCGRKTVQLSTNRLFDLKQLESELALNHPILTPFLLRVTVNGLDVAIFKDGRIHIRGTEDTKIAQEMYEEYFARLVHE